MARDLIPYWLAAGMEICDVCSGTHVLQMRYFCVGCDSGCCTLCIVTFEPSGDGLCPACAERSAG